MIEKSDHWGIFTGEKSEIFSQNDSYSNFYIIDLPLSLSLSLKIYMIYG